MLRAKTSALLRRKTCAVLAARTSQSPGARQFESVAGVDFPYKIKKSLGFVDRMVYVFQKDIILTTYSNWLAPGTTLI